MELYPQLATYASLLLVFAVVAGVLALGTLTGVVLANRRTRIARHETVRTYYRGLVLSH